jgi:hypothetical protein
VWILEGDEAKMAMVTRYGSFEFLVMHFGLCKAPTTFLFVRTLHTLSQSSMVQVWRYSCKDGRWIFWDGSWSLSLVPSSLRCMPYPLVYLGGVLGDISWLYSW